MLMDSFTFYLELDFIFYKVAFEDDIDAQLTLASLILEDDKTDEAIYVLSPPNNLGIIMVS